MTNLIYTGIGSRETPSEIQSIMTSLAYQLDLRGYTLRSGGAVGADQAFQKGVSYQTPEIYLPDERSINKENWKVGIVVSDPLIVKKAAGIAKRIHGHWYNCNEYQRALLVRNVYQILGGYLAIRTGFVVFWAPEFKGLVAGGTKIAVHLAREMGIKTYNLKDERTKETFIVKIDKMAQETENSIVKM